MTRQDGFSLLELSVAMIIIGLVMTPVFQGYKLKILEDRQGTTDSNLALMLPKAIDDFYFAHNRYPCPANPTLNETSSLFGVEACADPAVATADPAMLQGEIPFKTMNLARSYTIDGFNNRMSYAVTTAHTIAGGPSATPGYLRVTGYQIDQTDFKDRDVDADGNPVIANYTPDGAGYVIVSHGQSGVGAYTQAGVLVAVCPTNNSTLDSENCDRDRDFFHHTAARSFAAGAEYYDDKIYFQGAAPSRIFAPSPSPGENALVSTYGYFGINNSNPQVEVDVTGDVLAEGNVHALDYCIPNSDGVNGCFTAATIGGSGIGCDYNMTASSRNGVMTGIGNAQAKCDVANRAVVPKTCNSDEYLSGIDASGSPICSVY